MGAKCTECGHEHADWIPKDRFDTVVDQRKQLKEQLETATAKVSELETELATKDKELGKLETLTTELESYKAKEQAWGLERAIVRSGITDDEGVRFTTLAWQSIPDDKKPEGGISAWLSDPDALPKGVRAYMPEPSSQGAGAAQGGEGSQAGQGAAGDGQGAQGGSTQTGQGKPHPRPNPGGHPDPKASGPSGPKFTGQQLRSMSDEEYLRHREAILAQARQR